MIERPGPMNDPQYGRTTLIASGVCWTATLAVALLGYWIPLVIGLAISAILLVVFFRQEYRGRRDGP